MSYTLEKTQIGTDIVINGWDEGIIDNPYSGIFDMRNCDPVTIPGEISIAMSTQASFTPIAITNVTVTVDHTTDVFTYNGTVALTIGTAIKFTNSGGALPAGLTATDAYYILTVPTPTTFTISLGAGAAQKVVTDNGSGTNTFSVINMGTPIQIIGKADLQGFYAMYDSNGRIWGYLASSAGTYNNRWIYLNNLADETTTGTMGNICVWRGYLFLFSSAGVGYVEIDSFSVMSLKTSWDLDWQTSLNGIKHDALVSINDDSVYFCNDNYVGLLAEQVAKLFDPTDPTTYIYDDSNLPLPEFEVANCLAELGSMLMIGGQSNYIYPWDRISPNFTTPIFLSENFVSKMVTINTTMYIFAGYKGRIFITNGANATPFYKIPEYLSKTTNPYIIWKDAAFNNNQLYFGFSCTTNSGTTINEYGGLWAVDVDSVQPISPRLQNIMSYGTYSGYVSAICQFRGINYTILPNNNGYGLFVGWNNGTTGGIDITTSTPYTNGESYIDLDPLPVGTFLLKRTLQNIQYKLGVPLVAGESVELWYRLNINENYAIIPITEGGQTGDISGLGINNFENAQWIQIRVILKGTATNPSYIRLREVRLS